MRNVPILRSSRSIPPKKLFLAFASVNALVFIGVTIFAILSATHSSHQFSTADHALQRQVNNNIGPSGTLTILHRLRDAIGTAVQTWGFGPGRKHDIRHTRLNSPLPFVYRDTVSALSRSECTESSSDSGCELLTKGFGTVGVVRYSFSAERENIVGTSTQVQTACRCIGPDCDKALLMRPVNITERRQDGNVYTTAKKSCIYQFYEGDFTDCHAETLRMQQKASAAETRAGYFTFEVDASQHHQGIWKAVGHRGWDYGCVKDDFYSLPTVNLSAPMANISSDIHQYPPSAREGIPSLNQSDDCRPPPNVRYFRDADQREGEECAAAFQFAIAGASFLGTQMDEVAIGKDQRTYIRELPTLLVFWEIMILICAATLGLYFAISAFLRFRKKGEWSYSRMLKLLAVQLMSLVFEGLPLYFALSLESVASRWTGRFAYMGATVALGRDVLQPQAVAHGNVLVLTAVVGESSFASTHLVTVAMFSAVVNLAAVVIVALVLFAFFSNRARQTEHAEQTGHMEAKFVRAFTTLRAQHRCYCESSECASSKVTPMSSFDDLCVR